MNIMINYLFINIILLFVFTNIFKDKLKYIKYDDDIAKYIVDNVKVFKFIHPNIITLSSFFINIIIFNLFKTNSNKLPFFLFLRWLTDILDGQIARKYNKKSKIGHTLDTLSDIMLSGIYLYLTFTKYNISINYFFILYSLFIFYCKYSIKLFDTHENVKNCDKSSFAFFINNSYILFTIAYFL